MTEIGLPRTGCTRVFLVILATTHPRGGGNRGSLPVRAAPLMTKRERNRLRNDRARSAPCPGACPGFNGEAILRPARGLDRSRSTSVRNRFSSKRVDFVLEDRVSGEINRHKLSSTTAHHDRSADRQTRPHETAKGRLPHDPPWSDPSYLRHGPTSTHGGALMTIYRNYTDRLVALIDRFAGRGRSPRRLSAETSVRIFCSYTGPEDDWDLSKKRTRRAWRGSSATAAPTAYLEPVATLS